MTGQDFQFTRFDVTTLGSVTAIMATLKSLCGLYVLRSADRDAYVGQSVNVAQRFLAQVRHAVLPWERSDRRP